MKRGYEYQQDRIDNVLLELADRGDAFFDDKLAVTNVYTQLRPSRTSN